MLKEKFKANNRPVAIVRCKQETDLATVTYWDLLILMGIHLLEIADEHKCALPVETIQAIDDFWKDVEITQTSLHEQHLTAEAGASAGTPTFLKFLQFKFGVTGELTRGYEKRKQIQEKVEKNSAEWIGLMSFVGDFIANKLNGRRPILIYEDLDKLDEIAPDKVWEIFNNHPLGDMPFPIIYTFPISLSYDPRESGRFLYVYQATGAF